VAASPRPPSWAIGRAELSAGVLGETALPWYWVVENDLVAAVVEGEGAKAK